ncbi:hypothetical protein B0H13DRAFT_2402693 [Mycena leptocephala]|nr:hypothetical protein B0H13DRAFT_2402693 [Mycena leptocephala]
MSTHSHCPTIVEVDDIDHLDIRKTTPLLDPLGPALKNTLEHKPTDMPFQRFFITSAIYPDFMLLTSYLWKFILVFRPLDYKLLNGSAPRSSQEFSPILWSSSNLSDSDHPHGLCINFAAANGVDAQSAVFQAPVPTDDFTSCMDRTLDARAASSLRAPEYAPFGLNSLSSSNGSAPRSLCIVHHNEPLVPALCSE